MAEQNSTEEPKWFYPVQRIHLSNELLSFLCFLWNIDRGNGLIPRLCPRPGSFHSSSAPAVAFASPLGLCAIRRCKQVYCSLLPAQKIRSILSWKRPFWPPGLSFVTFLAPLWLLSLPSRFVITSSALSLLQSVNSTNSEVRVVPRNVYIRSIWLLLVKHTLHGIHPARTLPSSHSITEHVVTSALKNQTHAGQSYRTKSWMYEVERMIQLRF